MQQRKGVLLRDIGGTQQQFVKADTDTFSDVNRPSDTTFQKPAVIAGVSYELIEIRHAKIHRVVNKVMQNTW